MARARQDSEAASGGNQRRLTLDSHEDFSGEHVEKLLGALVMVANLGSAWRHDFFDHA
jgi:hypothetical protein